MKLPKHKSVGLLTGLNQEPSFFENYCDTVSYHDGNGTVWQSKPALPLPAIKPMLYSVRSVPPYLQLQFVKDHRFRIKKYPSVTAYSICLDKLTNIDDYMHLQFRKRARGNILRVVRRLEACFNIRYKRFFGDIGQEECRMLMGLLKEMIRDRFRERNEQSDTLKNWELITGGIYDQIISKEASLFVIYQEDTPVCISVAYHYQNLFFYYITSYDTDYSKFSPGTIMLYKQLEWCLDNRYRYFDMGYGDLEYKKWWSNHIYTLERYMFFPKNSPAYYLLSSLEGNKTRLMAFLISKKINIYYKKVLGIFKGQKQNEDPVPGFRFEPVQDLRSYGNLETVDPEAAPYLFLKTVLCDFLYHSQKHLSEVKLHYSPSKDTFLLIGKDNFKKIVFEA